MRKANLISEIILLIIFLKHLLVLHDTEVFFMHNLKCGFVVYGISFELF